MRNNYDHAVLPASGTFSRECKCVNLFYCCGCRLEEILEIADDMAIDIPHFWVYLAELITPMLHEGGIPMGQLFR